MYVIVKTQYMCILIKKYVGEMELEDYGVIMEWKCTRLYMYK